MRRIRFEIDVPTSRANLLGGELWHNTHLETSPVGGVPAGALAVEQHRAGRLSLWRPMPEYGATPPFMLVEDDREGVDVRRPGRPGGRPAEIASGRCHRAARERRIGRSTEKQVLPPWRYR